MPNLSLNALTIDVEDWSQLAHYKLLGCIVPASSKVLTNTHLILDLLAEHNVRATFFILGRVAEQYPELVLSIQRDGHEVATHGYSHRLISILGAKEFEVELRRSINILEDIVQEPILGNRAAEFSINNSTPWAWEIMAAAGLRYDSSVFPIQHPYYGVPTAPTHPYWVHTSTGNLMEFPPATVRLFGQNLPIAGGGYMRILPLKLICWGIQALNHQGDMAVIYTHPYEFSKEWLDLPVPIHSTRQWLKLRLRALKRNWGRGHPMQDKFISLLKSYHFAPLREVMVNEPEWQSSNVLSTTRPTIRPVISTESPSV